MHTDHPTIISVDAASNRMSWRTLPVESVFHSGQSVEYERLIGGLDTHVPDDVHQSTDNPASTRSIHPVPDGRRQHERAIIVGKVLRRARRAVETMKAWGVMPMSAKVGQGALFNTRSGARFAEMNWATASGTKARHWIRLKIPAGTLWSAPSRVAFVTGTCLFGRSDAIAWLADGQRHPLVSGGAPLPSSIRRLDVRRGLSPYELDTACRLSAVIGNLASYKIREASVYVHVPVPEYVLSLFGRHGDPLDPAVVRQWISAVRERGAEVARLFEKRLLSEQRELDVTIGSPLDMLLPYLCEMSEQGVRPEIPDMLALIRASSPVMEECLEWWLSDHGETTIEVDQLAHFGYCAGVLAEAAGGPEKLTIEVENPSEERIFRVVTRIAKRARKHGSTQWTGNMIALYPHEQTVEASEGVLDFEASRGLLDYAHDRPTGLLKDLMRQYGCS